MSYTLAQIKQKEKESLKDFLNWFYAEVAQISLISDAMQLHCAIKGVQLGTQFGLALSKEIPASIDDFRQKAARYIWHEEHPEIARTLKAGSSKPATNTKET